MSRMLAQLLDDPAALEAFAAAIHDVRAPAIGRKTLWADQTEQVRFGFISGVRVAVCTALASQISPLAHEPLPNPPALGVVLCQALQWLFPTPRFKVSMHCKGAARRKAVARDAAEQRTLWRPAVIAGLDAYAQVICSQIGAADVVLKLPGLDTPPERTAA